MEQWTSVRSGRPAASTDTIKAQWAAMLDYHLWSTGSTTGEHPAVPCNENDKPANEKQISALTHKLCTREFELPLIAKLRLIVNHLLESGDTQFQTQTSVLEYYDSVCTERSVQSKLASLRVSISLTSDSVFNVSPQSDQVLVGFSALVAKRYEIDPSTCIPPEDIDRLLASFKGEEALEKFINRLRNVQHQHSFDTGRILVMRNSDARHHLCSNVEQALVTGHHMLINVHGKNWDALTALSERVLRKFWKTDTSSLPVIYLPLQSCFRVDSMGSVTAESKALSLEDLMGHLLAYVEHGEKYDAARDVKKISRGEFDSTLNQIREKIKTAPCIFIIDGLYIQGNAGSERQRIERQIRDDHWIYIISRLLEPVISLDDEPTALDQFARNRVFITSNQAVSITSAQSDLHAVPRVKTQPSISPIPLVAESALLLELDADDRALNEYAGILSYSIDHAERVEAVFTSQAGQYIKRNDTVHHLLSAIFSATDALNKDSANSLSITDQSVHALLLDHATTDESTDSVKIVSRTLIQLFDHMSSERSSIWRELLFLVSITPEGIRSETVERIVRRMQFVFPESARRLPSLSQAWLNDSLPKHINEFADCMRSILGFIREEYVEGTESGDHREEYWAASAMADSSSQEYVTSDDVPYQSLSALDFRYPEIRDTLLTLIDNNEVEFGAEVIHRLICEIAVQHQVIQLRHADVRASANIRHWHHCINAIYHGLMSLRFEHRGSSGHEHMVLIEQEFGSRDLDCKGTSREFWQFVYYNIYRDLLEGGNVHRLHRVHGLVDLKIALLRVLENPWLLTWDQSEIKMQHGVWGNVSRTTKRLTVNEKGDSKIRFQYGYEIVLSHLARSGAEKARRYLFEYLITESELIELHRLDSLDKQIIHYVNMSKEISPERLKTLNLLLQVLNQKIEYLDIECIINPIAERLKYVNSIIGLTESFRVNLDTVLSGAPSDLSEVFEDWHVSSDVENSIVGLLSENDGSRKFQELVRLFSRMVDLLSNYADYMAVFNLYSDKVQEHPNDNLDEWNERVSIVLRKLNRANKNPEKLRVYAFSLALAIERMRAIFNRIRPDELISRQSTSLSHTTVNLALKLNTIYKIQSSTVDKLQRTPFENYVRRVCDAQLRIDWQLPMNKAHCFILEANLLKVAAGDEMKKISRINKNIDNAMKVSRAFEIQRILQTKEEYFKRADNLLSLARNMIGRAERLLVAASTTSQLRIKLALIRTQLHRDLALLYALHGQEHPEEFIRTCQQLSEVDIAFLNRVGNFKSRGFPRVLAYYQSLEI